MNPHTLSQLWVHSQCMTLEERESFLLTKNHHCEKCKYTHATEWNSHLIKIISHRNKPTPYGNDDDDDVDDGDNVCVMHAHCSQSEFGSGKICI